MPCARLNDVDDLSDEDDADLLERALRHSGIPTVEQLEGTSNTSTAPNCVDFVGIYGDGVHEGDDSALWTPHSERSPLATVTGGGKRRARGQPSSAKRRRVPPTSSLVSLPSSEQPPFQDRETKREREPLDSLPNLSPLLQPLQTKREPRDVNEFEEKRARYDPNPIEVGGDGLF